MSPASLRILSIRIAFFLRGANVRIAARRRGWRSVVATTTTRGRVVGSRKIRLSVNDFLNCLSTTKLASSRDMHAPHCNIGTCHPMWLVASSTVLLQALGMSTKDPRPGPTVICSVDRRTGNLGVDWPPWAIPWTSPAACRRTKMTCTPATTSLAVCSSTNRTFRRRWVK